MTKPKFAHALLQNVTNKWSGAYLYAVGSQMTEVDNHLNEGHTDTSVSELWGSHTTEDFDTMQSSLQNADNYLQDYIVSQLRTP
jgi:hypothetical protein